MQVAWFGQSDIYYRQNNGKHRIELIENKETECTVSQANHIAFLKKTDLKKQLLFL